MIENNTTSRLSLMIILYCIKGLSLETHMCSNHPPMLAESPNHIKKHTISVRCTLSNDPVFP